MNLAEFSCTILPSSSFLTISLHFTIGSLSFVLQLNSEKSRVSSLYSASFSIFWAIMELRGFLSSCDTQALIKEVNSTLALNSVYRIWCDTSTIWINLSFLPLLKNSFDLNWTYCSNPENSKSCWAFYVLLWPNSCWLIMVNTMDSNIDSSSSNICWRLTSLSISLKLSECLSLNSLITLNFLKYF